MIHDAPCREFVPIPGRYVCATCGHGEIMHEAFAAKPVIDRIGEFDNLARYGAFDRPPAREPGAMTDGLPYTMPADGRCRTCKHWDREGLGDTSVHLGLGICQAVPMYWNSTEWVAMAANPELGIRWAANTVNTTAFAQDGSDYKALLYTKAEHGCTMYAAKPDDRPPSGADTIKPWR